jgi:hypothetical protein
VMTAADEGLLEVSRGRPLDDDEKPFGPPRYFLCPLNGRA